MRKLTYYIGTTLDGYAAGPGGEIDFQPSGAASGCGWVRCKASDLG